MYVNIHYNKHTYLVKPQIDGDTPLEFNIAIGDK